MTPLTHRSPALIDHMARRLNRRALITSGSLLSAGALLGRVELLRTAAQESPELGNTINAAITLEAFAVSFYGAARGGDVNMRDDVAQFARTAQCEEDAHYHFFEAAGAAPITTSFTIPERQLKSQGIFLGALLDVESLLVGMYMAATRQFAASGDLRLVEIGYQIGAVEAQHVALTRQLLDEPIPADRAFAQWLFEDPAEAVTALEDLGYIGGNGETVNYPGPVDRQCRGVTGLVPETTEDKPADELPPAASPQADARA
jgi:hypothetical protein